MIDADLTEPRVAPDPDFGGLVEEPLYELTAEGLAWIADHPFRAEVLDLMTRGRAEMIDVEQLRARPRVRRWRRLAVAIAMLWLMAALFIAGLWLVGTMAAHP